MQKRNRQRVNVHLDGRFAFGLAAIEAVRLQVGQELSPEEIAHLQERDVVERAAEKALNFLSYRPRSRAEVRRRLLSKSYEAATVDETLDRLTRAGLLDDREFARYWVENRFQFNPRGVAALRRELRQKGVEDAVIAEALATFDEEEAALRAATAAARRLQRLDPATFKRRLVDYMRRRGFFYAVIEPAVKQVMADYVSEEQWEESE